MSSLPCLIGEICQVIGTLIFVHTAVVRRNVSGISIKSIALHFMSSSIRLCINRVYPIYNSNMVMFYLFSTGSILMSLLWVRRWDKKTYSLSSKTSSSSSISWFTLLLTAPLLFYMAMLIWEHRFVLRHAGIRGFLMDALQQQQQQQQHHKLLLTLWKYGIALEAVAMWDQLQQFRQGRGSRQSIMRAVALFAFKPIASFIFPCHGIYHNPWIFGAMLVQTMLYLEFVVSGYNPFHTDRDWMMYVFAMQGSKQQQQQQCQDQLQPDLRALIEQGGPPTEEEKRNKEHFLPCYDRML